MDNNELSFQSIMTKLKSAKCQLIVQLTGIWFAGGKYGCSWKIISGKFQLHQNTKITFIVDSDTENVFGDDEDDDIINSEAIAATNNVIQDEEEDDEYEEDEDEPAKPVEPVKKQEAEKPAKKPVKKTAK
jgi:hypothetical protein